jgi:hypothetical protein
LGVGWAGLFHWWGDSGIFPNRDGLHGGPSGATGRWVRKPGRQAGSSMTHSVGSVMQGLWGSGSRESQGTSGKSMSFVQSTRSLSL